MNHREPPHLSAGMRRALHCLSLLLVPALTLDNGQAGPRLRNAISPNAEPAPYLPVLGSPSLRVDVAPPTPDLVTRPAAGAPPVPALTPTESTVAVANADAARSTVGSSEETSTVEPKIDSTPVAPAPAPAVKTPPPILPDSTRPVVHPEDFLPFFQVPGTGRPDVTVVVPGIPAVPTPSQLPPSSATYTQTPR